MSLVGKLGQNWRSPPYTIFLWLVIGGLPLFGTMLLITLHVGGGQGIYYLAGFYAASLILNSILLFQSKLRDDTKVGMLALSFLVPIGWWVFFILLTLWLGLFEAT